ncbi:MAG: HDOD domain-containing protein, partial [Deltaproteobacteria bacterium]|nr:HDOD domain-containing protein [Deltaproteobacteria bacterium]
DNAFPLFYRRTQERNEALVNVERELFGMDHTTAGGKLAELWGLPERLVHVIKYHHHPEKSEHDPDLTYLVYLADLLMSRVIAGQELERQSTDSLHYCLERVGIHPNQLAGTIEGLSDIITSLSI